MKRHLFTSTINSKKWNKSHPKYSWPENFYIGEYGTFLEKSRSFLKRLSKSWQLTKIFQTQLRKSPKTTTTTFCVWWILGRKELHHAASGFTSLLLLFSKRGNRRKSFWLKVRCSIMAFFSLLPPLFLPRKNEIELKGPISTPFDRTGYQSSSAVRLYTLLLFKVENFQRCILCNLLFGLIIFLIRFSWSLIIYVFTSYLHYSMILFFNFIGSYI